MEPTQLSFIFVVAAVCVVQVLRDARLASLLLVACVAWAAWTSQWREPTVDLDQLHRVFVDADPQLQRALAAQAAHRSFDPALHDELQAELQRFLNLHGRLLMAASHQVAAHDLEELCMRRRAMLQGLESLLVRSSHIDVEAYKREVLAPFMQCTRRYIRVLTNKHPHLKAAVANDSRGNRLAADALAAAWTAT